MILVLYRYQITENENVKLLKQSILVIRVILYSNKQDESENLS